MEAAVPVMNEHFADMPHVGRISRLMDGVVRPLDAAWDPVGQTCLLSRNEGIESFSRDWQNLGSVFTGHVFDNTPYMAVVGDSLICTSSRGGGTLVRFSLVDRRVMATCDRDYHIGRLDSLGKDMLLASCYTDQSDTFLVVFDESLHEVDRLEFGRWKTLPAPADMQYSIVDENRLLLLEQREWSSQHLVEYRLDTRQEVSRLPIPGIQMLITCIQYHDEVVYAAGHSFFAMLDMSAQVNSITYLNRTTLSFMRRVSIGDDQELLIADIHNGFVFRYPLGNKGLAR